MTRVEKPGLRAHDIAADEPSELLRQFPEMRTEAGEIGFNRYFYDDTPPRRLEESDTDLKKAEEENLWLLREVTE